ncbi:MAG TPA: hypothetical protein VHQ03_08355, partial [Candidatus Dormibacteraeota bacterium]|nr:hypothetical protein [Candidatus Dormibacteraeota bacterium]
MHSADQRWTSIHAEGIEWTDFVLRHKAVRRAMDSRQGSTQSSGRGFKPVFGRYRADAANPPNRVESAWRVWLRSAAEYRAETDFPGVPGITQIVRDKTWWTWHQDGPVRSNQGDETHGTGPVIQALSLLRPAALLPQAEFDFVG